MRKVLIGSAIVLVVFAPLTSASAAIADEPLPAPSGAPFGHDDAQQDDWLGIHDSKAEDLLHHELEKRYGKHGAFQIPPLVLKPGADNTVSTSIIVHTSVTGQSAATGQTTEVTGQASLPSQQGVGAPYGGAQQPASIPNFGQTTVDAKPIDFATINFNQETPAQQFFRVSSILLATLAAGAVLVGGVIGLRALRAVRVTR